jgi:GTP-binding protein
MMVKIRDARFAGSIYEKKERLPEVAVAGRSNVGKSSLINALLNRKSLVKTSKLPGKTRNINYFRVDLVDRPSLYLVDMPGYGYAKVPRGMVGVWERLAKRYFLANADLRLLLLLIDIRRDMRDEEWIALDLIKHTPAKAIVIATKTDKISPSERQRKANELHAACGNLPIISSSSKKWGMDQIWQAIIEALPA